MREGREEFLGFEGSIGKGECTRDTVCGSPPTVTGSLDVDRHKR